MRPGSRAAGAFALAHSYHDLEVSAFYVALVRMVASSSGAEFKDWRVFDQPISPGLPLIPDAYALLAASDKTYAMFLEVDRGTEPLRIWRSKGERYLELARSGQFEARFGQPSFRVLVVASSQRRVQNIRQTIAALTDRVFWFAEFQVINRVGLSAAVWLRPIGEERRSLLYRKEL